MVKNYQTMTFIMPLHDIRNKNSFHLFHENIIVHYNVVEDLENFNNSASHENSKGRKFFVQPCIP